MSAARNRMMHHRISLLAVLATLLLSVAGPVRADAGADMREANRLVRAGLYRAALFKYREARAGGLDSPLLHYNMGVAHYKARPYTEAKKALREASLEPRLAALAYYNMGLVHHAEGDPAGARRWFQLAVERSDNTKVQKRAAKALDRNARRLAAEANGMVAPTLTGIKVPQW